MASMTWYLSYHPIDNIWAMMFVWRLRGLSELLCAGLCDTMFTVSSTFVWEVHRSSRLGLSDWDPYAMHRGLEAVAWSCIIVTWWSGPGGIQALSERPTGFLQCFDTVGLVLWPVKIVPEMTYNVFGGTLSLYTYTTTATLHT